MSAFKINGLRVVNNSRIEPVHYELQDPKGPNPEPDTSFVVRSNLDDIFYYYQQVNQVWIRTRLSDGMNAADLNFYEIMFRRGHPIPQAIGASVVNRLLAPELVPDDEGKYSEAQLAILRQKRIDINNKLLNASAEYNIIMGAAEEEEEETLQVSSVIAPIIPVVEAPYTGLLSVADRAVLNTNLSSSGLEKPNRPAHYSGLEVDWQNAWDRALAHALSTPLRLFEKNMPANTPSEIKDTLAAMLSYLDPRRIDKYRFDRRADADITEKPMIGHVYDDIQQYFYKMLSNPTLCPPDRLTKLSPAFYNIRVGKLNNNTAMVYTGLSLEQDALVMALVNDFESYGTHLNTHDSSGTFSALNKKYFSIEMMNYIINLMTNDIIMVEAEEQILNDFFAIALASSEGMDITAFDERYHRYKDQVRQQLTSKLKELEEVYQRFLASNDHLEFMQSLPIAHEATIIISLPAEKLLSLCKEAWFISDYNIQFIIEALPLTSLTERILNRIRDQDKFKKICASLPSGKAIGLVQLLGSERLCTICEDRLDDVLKRMPEDLSLALIKTIGNDGINKLVTDGEKLTNALTQSALGARNPLITMVGNKNLRKIISRDMTLMAVMRFIHVKSWPMLFAMLGTEHVVKLIGTLSSEDRIGFAGALTCFDTIYKIKFITSLRSALGPGIFKLLIRRMSELRFVFDVMPKDSQVPLLRIFGGQWLSEMLSDPYDSLQILDLFSAPAAAELKVLMEQASTQNLPTQATSFVAYQNNNNNNTVTHETQVVNENTEQFTM